MNGCELMKFSNEIAVMSALGLQSWRNLSKDNVFALASMIPDMDKDVALKIVEQIPELTQLALRALETVEAQHERSLDFNEKSNQRVHASYEDFREILKVELNRELTPKQRADIYKLLMESADKQSVKDTENKRFLEGLFSKAAIVGAVLAVGLLAVFGSLANIESEDESNPNG